MRLLTVLLLFAGLVHGPLAWAEDEPTTRSGYERVRPTGGPDSVNSALRRHDSSKDSYFRFHVLENALRPWYRFKRRLKDRHGLAIGADFNLLHQQAVVADTNHRSNGGVFRLYGHWTFAGRGTPTTSEIVFRVENRSAIDTQTSPSNFNKEIGVLLSTANSFSDFGWGVTNLQFQQWWKDGRYGIAVGQVDLRDWVDAFDLSNWRTALLSAATTYPTNPLPSAGLGAGVFAYFRECSTPYVLAGFSDANGHPDRLGFDTFFHDQELYSYLEAGWTPSFKEKDDKNLRLTYWHQDPRKEAGVAEGWGLSFSAAWKFHKRWAPFLRGGIARGGVIASDAGLVAGLGIHRRSHDLFGTALGWASAYDDSLPDQVTWETFYRLQLSQNIGITPDVEVIWDPSNNPTEDLIVVLGLRMQLVL